MNTLVQLFAFGSSSSTVVICFRKSDSCIPGWDPRRLNTAFGLDKMTWRLTANPLWEVFKKHKKRETLKYWYTFLFLYKTLVTWRAILYATMCQVLLHKVEKEHYLYYSLKKKSSHYNITSLVPSQRCSPAGSGWGSVKSLVLIIKGRFYKLLFHRSHHTQHLTLWGQLRPKCSGKAFTFSLIELQVIMWEPAQFCLL